MTEARAAKAGADAPAKRVKTGGRAPKKSIEQMLSEARQRAELAAMPDDTTLPAELAALYLCISTKQLAEMRKSMPASSAPSRKGVKLRMIKLVDRSAIGMNQPVTYKLGDLRAFQLACSGHDTFEVSLAVRAKE